MMNKLDSLVILFLIVDELNEKGSMQIDDTTDGDDMPGKLLNLNRVMVERFSGRFTGQEIHHCKPYSRS